MSACTDRPQSPEEKLKKLAQIQKLKNKMLESFSNISASFQSRKRLVATKYEIENFFESQISDLKNLYGLP